MRKNLFTLSAIAIIACLTCLENSSSACTNIIVTPGASVDGSAIVSYAADSHVLYGELYFHPAADWKRGSMLEVTEWDTYRPLGRIPQVAHTWQTMGNMNEHQLIIAETTWGGRPELADPEGGIDYGSLIYITLQRAKTAREAIDTIVALAGRYGYCSEGESFTIADTREAWIMDLAGKGSDSKGLVWVARRIPDGYISAHANQARVARFPLDEPESCLYAPDVISSARSKGWFDGQDEQFSYRDAYCPLDFGGGRAGEARASSAMRSLGDGVFTYEKEDGSTVSCSADEWLSYAMGYELDSEMPLWIRPQRKISVKDVADAMRDHFEGTPMDMTTDIGAGGNACPYRWRPMNFEWDGVRYVNERAIATQQTGFWFVAQARGYLPREVGALLWFGCDDAATSYLTPIYVSSKEVPECLEVGNGDMLHYSPTSTFWLCNRVANACYKMYNHMAPYVRERADKFENDQMQQAVPEMDAKLCKLLERGRKRKAIRMMTRYTVSTAQDQFKEWKELEETLLIKFMDGNVKAQDENGEFVHTQYNTGTPDEVGQPDYTEKGKEAVARDKGDILKAGK